MSLTTSETMWIWILFALVVQGAVAGNPDAKRLYDDLLSNYNKLVRPVVNTSDVLKVSIKLKLSQLIDVVCANECLDVRVFIVIVLVLICTEPQEPNNDNQPMGGAGK